MSLADGVSPFTFRPSAYGVTNQPISCQLLLHRRALAKSPPRAREIFAPSLASGARFVDVTDLYSSRLRALCREVDPSLPEGVYAQFHGPHYETPAELRMVRAMAEQERQSAHAALQLLGTRADRLKELADLIVTRSA